MTLNREPALYISTIAAALGLLVTFNIDALSAEQAAAIVAVITAVAGAVTAWTTRPIAPSVFTAVVASVATLLAAYGLDVSQETVGAVNALVLAVLTLIFREQVGPVTAPAGGGHSR